MYLYSHYLIVSNQRKGGGCLIWSSFEIISATYFHQESSKCLQLCSLPWTSDLHGLGFNYGFLYPCTHIHSFGFPMGSRISKYIFRIILWSNLCNFCYDGHPIQSSKNIYKSDIWKVDIIFLLKNAYFTAIFFYSPFKIVQKSDV